MNPRAAIYLEKFGLRILEGYGVTETAPALALNTPMFNKFGTVGRLLPGMEARLEKVEGVDEGGRMFVKGPNVMLGYLRAENPGVLEAPAGGLARHRRHRGDRRAGLHHHQGARQALRQDRRRDGVVGGGRDAGRRSVARSSLAVASVPDARKGERLILFTQKPGATRADFIAFARSRHASELMIPSDVVVMEKMPLLGSGKVDLVAIGKLAKEHAETTIRKPAVIA